MNQATSTELADAKHPHAGKFLTFALGKEEYGLQILKVREIIGLMEITAVPKTASYVRGVINLRGQVIGVIDLRAKFGMNLVEQTDQTCIIVVEIKHESGRRLNTGIIVDRVSEVLDIPGNRIEESPTLASDEEDQFILGMAKIGDGVKILLDIDKVLAGADLTNLGIESKKAA